RERGGALHVRIENAGHRAHLLNGRAAAATAAASTATAAAHTGAGRRAIHADAAIDTRNLLARAGNSAHRATGFGAFEGRIGEQRTVAVDLQVEIVFNG